MGVTKANNFLLVKCEERRHRHSPGRQAASSAHGGGRPRQKKKTRAGLPAGQREEESARAEAMEKDLAAHPEQTHTHKQHKHGVQDRTALSASTCKRAPYLSSLGACRSQLHMLSGVPTMEIGTIVDAEVLKRRLRFRRLKPARAGSEGAERDGCAACHNLRADARR